MIRNDDVVAALLNAMSDEIERAVEIDEALDILIEQGLVEVGRDENGHPLYKLTAAGRTKAKKKQN